MNTDISGSVVNANQPVVIAFNAIAQVSDASVANADHIEETVLRAEVEYTFLAATHYLEKSAEVILRSGAEVTLDGTPIAVTPEPVGTSEWSFARVPPRRGNGRRAPDRDHGRARLGPKLISEPPLSVVK